MPVNDGRHDRRHRRGAGRRHHRRHRDPPWLRRLYEDMRQRRLAKEIATEAEIAAGTHVPAWCQRCRLPFGHDETGPRCGACGKHLYAGCSYD
jgi:hypothetical protein